MRFSLFAAAAFVASAVARSLPLDTPAALSARQSRLPSSFKWSSSDVLVSAKKDSHNAAGIKDPSIVQVNGVYHVFASAANNDGYSLVYFSFTDFSKANQAQFFYLDQTKIGTGYRAAPEVFYMSSQKMWYLVYQNGNAAYSTNPDISNPAGWSAPQVFYPNGTPATIRNNIGKGNWVDMWVICDSANCHLFSSDDNGHLYRSQTPVSSFPRGMSEPVIVMQTANPNDLWEAANVYNVGGDQYLLLVECIGTKSSPGGIRYFRSWTSSNLAGPWTALAATEANPFIGAANVQFASGRSWTESFSHGEIVRTLVDQTLTINPCSMRYLYQGLNPSASAISYSALPWTLGLLTQVGSSC
ncbi:hypothetical protein PTNB85_08969 [Pyrenophora teres f. teres]|uniref:Alpha-L-arabinofuranosidase n=1 Tax=Pyrenophora teres f. teres TaxID=97479 RepID=A0A6S6VUQ9_9PLEO|nr:hypothetical protein HRS9139_10188 [Pyrenophora teres f. teres]KAE8826024.1 hypothetical protein PTNB85_08969 [Pyrenophora teres f. teres]KAE8852917.1 hypothetical protein PTNB29_10307 [Pyrenophora teres f. teres]CAE7000656.1 Glycoside hydrolase family 62 protein [Pyrenophora teres f. teres]